MKASQELDRIMAKYGTSASSSYSISSSAQDISRISFNDSSIGKKQQNNDIHSNHISPNKQTYHNNSHHNTVRTTNNITKSTPIPADTLQSQLGGTTAVTNIVAAFRELQTKLKIIEEERAIAFRDREETKRQLENLRKEFAIKQSTLEINTTEQLLNTSASSEQLRTFLGEIQAQESSLHHIHGSLQRTVQAHKGILQGLEEDISELNPKIWSLEERKKILTEELRNVESRISQLEVQPLQKSHSDLVELAAMKSEIAASEAHISDLYNSTRRTNLRIAALEKYANLMTTVNGDLCNTILAREKTKERVLQFASLYTPPRYTWPKQLPYTEILSVINDAADNSTQHSTYSSHSNRNRVSRKDSIPHKARVSRSKSLSPTKYNVMSPQEGALIAATTMAAIAAQSSSLADPNRYSFSSARARSVRKSPINPKGFIPSSANPSNKQHNVHGIISVQSRNNKNLNSYLASRVLSLTSASDQDHLFDNLNSNDIAKVKHYIEKKSNSNKKVTKKSRK